MPVEPLPIDTVLPELTTALNLSSCVVLQAPTGAGKTTRVPPALIEAGFPGQVIVLEPRRLAARAAARRMAQERGEALGGAIGYHVRFDRKAGPATRILAVTPGILLRMLQDDPYLERVGVVVFDEFHERGLEADLALGMVRLVQSTVRPELRAVVMSATLATEAISTYLDRCPLVISEGRSYPVTITYEPRPSDCPWPQAAAHASERLLERTDGDLLVFLPGVGEIHQTARHLQTIASERDLAVVPLFGDLSPAEQDAALTRQSRRKIVLATNVAETSVTVDGITGVVDTGLARSLVFDAAVGLDRLELQPISKASADQRAGRAGRTQPGVCVRLWTEMSHRARPEQTEPEIRRLDLTGPLLQLLSFGEADLSQFPWLDPPPAAAVERARVLLRRLGASDDHGLTPLGQRMAALPVHPRLARMLLEGARLGHGSRVALAAAILSERDVVERGSRNADRGPASESDLLDRVEALEAFEAGRMPTLPIQRHVARQMLHVQRQLARLIEGENSSADLDADEALLRAVWAGFPDRLCRRREQGADRGVMVGGRGVRLGPMSSVTAAELFVAIDVDGAGTDGLVRLASAVDPDWLPAEQLTNTVEVTFDPLSERIAAWRRTRYEDLVIAEKPTSDPGPEAIAAALAEAAAARWERVRPSDESPAGSWRQRVRWLRAQRPDLDLPSYDDEEMRALLPEVCQGCRTLAAVREADWLGALRGRLTWEQRQMIEREAPERLTVPSGRAIALTYQEGRPPVLAARIQELFGWQEVPRLAGGRVKVLLHLLAPNHRPQQITDDLASFWSTTYPQIRKALRARYPKHDWPDDPLTAVARQRPGPPTRG